MIAALIILVRLLLIAVALYAVIYVYRLIKGSMSSFSTFNNPFRTSETCPVCHRPIQVSGDDMACPHCGVKLGRTPDGKLVIRVN